MRTSHVRFGGSRLWSDRRWLWRTHRMWQLHLAEDLRRPYTWLWMLLANSPVIWRVVVGTG